MAEHSEHEKGLFRVLIWGTALSFGILGAIVGSMKDFLRGDASFEFSFWTIAGFVVGFALGWLFWKIVLRRARKAEQKQSGST